MGGVSRKRDVPRLCGDFYLQAAPFEDPSLGSLFCLAWWVSWEDGDAFAFSGEPDPASMLSKFESLWLVDYGGNVPPSEGDTLPVYEPEDIWNEGGETDEAEEEDMSMAEQDEEDLPADRPEPEGEDSSMDEQEEEYCPMDEPEGQALPTDEPGADGF